MRVFLFFLVKRFSCFASFSRRLASVCVREHSPSLFTPPKTQQAMTTADSAAATPAPRPPARPTKRGRVALSPPPPANVIIDLVDDGGESLGV